MREQIAIVVKCQDCDERRVRVSDVTLRRCIDDDTWSYRFTCASCRRLTVASTNERAARDAIGAGSAVEQWHLPAEREHRPSGPPLTARDVLSLRERFRDPNWLDALMRRGEDSRSGESG